MKQGEIVLASIPQADGHIKNRPILLLRKLPKYDDFLVCGISTQLHQIIENFDELILPNLENHLKQPSLIRLTFLAVIPQEQIRGTLGKIPDDRHRKLLNRLADYLKQP
ncbi:type II toxin-antitoxin system PemK/MazF family toxin [Emticicia sp. TH156]|uniref:type II toxin-antitoxin system PemK/MazF family toxin n=1 Tax=Emticicia sp. TH156 TaxID=2067454 RepID=UPI000C77BE59|nr:type II toxin-antitoxin system PemK/MazF family toxin [Emticicia sp. TH156]PLK46000.1 transcriptional regulator [Emticicia sp. TH156]